MNELFVTLHYMGTHVVFVCFIQKCGISISHHYFYYWQKYLLVLWMIDIVQ